MAAILGVCYLPFHVPICLPFFICLHLTNISKKNGRTYCHYLHIRTSNDSFLWILKDHIKLNMKLIKGGDSFWEGGGRLRRFLLSLHKLLIYLMCLCLSYPYSCIFVLFHEIFLFIYHSQSYVLRSLCPEFQ